MMAVLISVSCAQRTHPNTRRECPPLEGNTSTQRDNILPFVELWYFFVFFSDKHQIISSVNWDMLCVVERAFWVCFE